MGLLGLWEADHMFWPLVKTTCLILFEDEKATKSSLKAVWMLTRVPGFRPTPF